MAILVFIVILGVLVFVHELGHFVSARRLGIAVEEFGFGFPPRLVGRKVGATIYSLNLIPFGGFVRLQGENNDSENRADSFVMAPKRKRFAVMIAGVVMNYLLAGVLFTLVLGVGIRTNLESPPADRVHQTTDSKVESYVVADGPAFKAGLKDGDLVTSVNDLPLTTTAQIVDYTAQHDYPVLNIVVQSDTGQTSTYQVSPDRTATPSPRYGFGLQYTGIVRYPWYWAPVYGAKMLVDITGLTLAGFGSLIKNLVVSGQVSADVTGPVGIAVLTGEITKLGLIPILQFTGLLSISLAVINFLPLPALDGGRAMFVIIEAIRRRPVSQRVESMVHAVGFYLLLALIMLISIRDFRRFEIFSKLSDWIR